MKKFGLIMTAILIAANVAAQDGPKKHEKDPVKMAKKRTEAMTKNLELTEAQIPQVEAINLDFLTKMKAIRSETERGPERKAKMDALETDTEGKMKAVLTNDQYVKFLEMKNRQKEKMRRKSHNPPHEKSE